jgi:ribosomal protein S18 acetylase RimI-like enzyme
VGIRKARQDDAAAVALLLFESAPEMYERFAGGRERALATLAHAFGEPGNVASSEVVWLKEIDGQPAAAMAAFPVAEASSRARAFLGLTLRRVPFWHRWRTLRLYWGGGRGSPMARDDSIYVDALATDRSMRRRGAASALLAEAERAARELGLTAVTLDTTIDNEGARALYADAGYDEVAYRRATRSLPGFVALVKPVDR